MPLGMTKLSEMCERYAISGAPDGDTCVGYGARLASGLLPLDRAA
jgi:hypothetical protein